MKYLNRFYRTVINGYKLSTPPEEIGGIDNLCITKRTINSKKNYKSESYFDLLNL